MPRPVEVHSLCLAFALVCVSAGPRVASADCEVEGVVSLEQLRVRLPDQRLRTMAITDLPVAVRPGRGNRFRDLRVLAPLSFSARTDAAIPWTVHRPRAVAGRMLWLSPTVPIVDAREGTDSEALTIRAEVEQGVFVDRVHLPCGWLTVGGGEEGGSGPDWGERRGPRWEPRRPHTWMVARPDDADAPALRLETPHGLPRPLIEVERRGDWVRVATGFSSGAALRGWVRAHHLRPVDSDGESPDEAFRRQIVTRDPPGCGPRARRRERVSAAHVESGTVVHAERAGMPWAAITEPALVRVAWRPGAEWARIVQVPGLRDDGECPEVLHRAWVRRESLTLEGADR